MFRRELWVCLLHSPARLIPRRAHNAPLLSRRGGIAPVGRERCALPSAVAQLGFVRRMLAPAVNGALCKSIREAFAEVKLTRDRPAASYFG